MRLRCILNSKIHMATVTDCELHYEGSITIDEEIINKVGMLPYEQVHVSNLNNGERFITYLIPAKRGSKKVILNGPTARKAMPGDRIIVFSYAWVEENKIINHCPRVVFLDEKNEIFRELNTSE